MNAPSPIKSQAPTPPAIPKIEPSIGRLVQLIARLAVGEWLAGHAPTDQSHKERLL
jgi:hypothetical protein